MALIYGLNVTPKCDRCGTECPIETPFRGDVTIATDFGMKFLNDVRLAYESHMESGKCKAKKI